MKQLGWSVLAIVLGAVVGCGVIFAIQSVNSLLYPFPQGLDPSKDPERFNAYVASLPPTAFIIVLTSWGVGTLAGAWLAAWLSPRARFVHGMIIGGLFLATGISIFLILPHPLWFTIVGLGVFLPAAWLGVVLAPGPYRRSAVDSGK
jgi:hypothetical protein